MGRSVRFVTLLIVTVLMVGVMAGSAAAQYASVTPGAFCAASQDGQFGRTVSGLLMRCTRTSADPRLRWRQFGADFGDVRGNTHESDISRLANAGVTKGCNPPSNTFYCPRDPVTREQMAGFLVRALGLTDANHPGFRDVPKGSTFDRDIRKLAKAGVTKGCNPPRNDSYCPKDRVTREQMAGFIVRGYGLTTTSAAGRFSDVPSSNIFRTDINRLATAAITKGCNPPTNSRYCPQDAVTRDQMASFLLRAGL